MATVQSTVVDFPSARRYDTTSLVRAVAASNPWEAEVPFLRRRVHRKQAIFRAGQPARNIYIVHAGTFKTCLVTRDGREQITGFRLQGEALGLESIDRATYARDVIALDVGELIEIPRTYLVDHADVLMPHVAGLLAQELRQQCRWMLALRTLGSEQRVVVFLLELADRFAGLGYSPSRLLLRMTRGELGNFLALSLETVVRVLSRLDAAGLISVSCRDVVILDPAALRSMAPAFEA